MEVDAEVVMRLLRIGLTIGLLAATSACSTSEESTPATGSPLPTVAPMTSVAPTTRPATTQPPVTTAPIETTLAPATTEVTTTTVAPTIVDVKVYLLSEERLVIRHREATGPALLRGALNELLAGPTPDELAEGLVSVIPDNTELLGLDLVEGLATVDLSTDFESGGGTLSMTARIAQVVFTATQFDNVDRVLFWLDGEPIDFLGGEGIVLDEPQARMDVDRSFTGGVIIDTPAPGDTVSSPFTVTGEGDVFEGEFPIEVWADGVLIGGVAPVMAGAWGEWAEFEATITLDAAPGPIELVAYDEGGCGTDPECPEIIKRVVPLTLIG
jgi:spore germination protein GerM